MAFRASHTSNKSKPDESFGKAQDEPVTPALTSPAMSVDDLVGAPQQNPPSEGLGTREPRTQIPEVKTEEKLPEPVVPEAAPTPTSFEPQNRPQVGGGYAQNRSPSFGVQDKHRFGGGFHRPQSGGYRQQSSSGYHSPGFRPFDPSGKPQGQYTPRPYPFDPSGKPQSAPFVPSNGYTQDIDVPTETVRGMLDSMPEGHGFLRPKFTPSDRDVYISVSQIRRFLLRNGDVVEGQARPPKDNERYYGLLKVEKVNDLPAEEMQKRPKFEDLTPVYPNQQLKLETAGGPLSTRMIDLVAPIGFGQRGLIVSPPKAGKTTILKELAAGIAANYPDVHLMAALIGERPEEVTDISRSVKGEVLASNFDESPAEQTRIAEVALDRAKRLVEMGRDVVILLDSITRLARAYNLVVNPSGRTLSGGFDPAALYPAKRFLGAARCVEPFASQDEAQGKPFVLTSKRVTVGGSLTVIGTALIETGSRMDDLIYEEFKGTGNMELTLSRSLQERRVFPAIDVAKSGTRHDELLLGEETMKKVTTLRHMLSMLSDEERTVMLIDRLGKTKSNPEFLDSLAKG